MRLALPGTALLLLTLGATPAGAVVDLNGPWRVSIDPDLMSPFSCVVDVVQTGSAITVDGSGCAIAFTLSGSVDTGTGAFTASGSSDPLACPTFSVSAVLSAAGDTFTGTFTCTGGFFPTSGTIQGGRCGNGVLDAGEDCEDGDVQDTDCCSPTCTFDPDDYVCGVGPCATGRCDGAGTCVAKPEKSGTQCPGDAIDCTDDVCDGAGACIHPNRPAGSSCFGDFNECTDGACDGAGACVLTNNTAPCDDYNACTVGDVCAGGSCQPGAPAPAGLECEADNDLCTIDRCDAVGGCVAAVGCSDCCGNLSCSAQLGVCKGPIVPAAKVLIQNSLGAGNRVLFSLKRGEQTDVLDFGDPLSSTGYTLCVYDGSPSPHLAYRASAPAGGTCAGRPCWRAIGIRGFGYKDRDRTPDGLDVVKLTAGGPGRSAVVVKGRGANLRIPYLGDGSGGGLELPVTVQLHSSDAACWEAIFTSATRDGGYEFRAAGGQ